MTFLQTLAHLTAGFLVSVGLLSGAPAAQPKLGAVIPASPALYSGFLASGIGSTDTSMTLSSAALKDGTSLSGWQCFTVDVNTPSVEYICGTASGTTVSSLMRGVLVSNPNSSSSALAYTHNRFATVDITDYPNLEIMRRQLIGLDAINSSLFYSAHPTSTASTTIEDKTYIDNSIVAGGVPATTGTPGITPLATQAQMASGTATTSYNTLTYSYVPQNRYFTSVPTTTASMVPVTNTSGTIAAAWIGQSVNDSYTFLGPVTLTGTSSAPYLVPVGTVEAYASSSAPNGWLLANGTEVTTTTYPALFSLIGYTFGGSTSTFKTPNLGGRFIAGPSAAISSTIGATGGSTSTLATTTMTFGTTNFTGGPTAAFSSLTGVTTTIGSIQNPYMILGYIIKY